MKICLVNPADVPRKEVCELGLYLSKYGHDITIIYPFRKKKLDCSLRIIPFPARFLPKIHYTIPNMLLQYRLLSRLINEERYDILQVCDYDYLTSLIPVVLRKKRKIPLVITTDAFPGISWFFGNIFVDFVGKLYTKSLGIYVINSCDQLIVLSNNLLADCCQLGIDSKKTHVIPNGVDFNQFNPTIDGSYLKKELNIQNDEKILLYVGRLSLVKRIEILIEVTKKFLVEGFKVKTIIVGTGEYEYYYKKMAEPIKDIIFVGHVPYSEIQYYFAIADVFVLPSLSEGLPNVLLEVSACGKPIVAANTGGVSDIVIHGKTGYLVEKDDSSFFVNYIKMILRDDDLAERFGKNSYMHVKNKFDWSAIIDKYETIYEQCIMESK